MPELMDTTLAQAQLDYARMSKPQRLAAFMVILGPESAALLLKKLEPVELETVTTEMTKLPLLGPELQSEIVREFSGLAIQASTGISGSIEFAQSVLEKSFGSVRAMDIITRVVPHRPPVATMQGILDLEPRPLANLLKHEQPQTIALVVSYLTAAKASQVLHALPEALREHVIERLATMAPTPVEVVERVASILLQKLGGIRSTRAPSRSGGIKPTAELMNALDKELSRSILTSMEERNPELTQSIRNEMFTFEDMVRLDSSTLQKILREVDMRDLALSLKSSSEALKKKLLGSISKRAAETVNEEMAFMTTVKAREIDASKLKIVETIRRLESEGDLDLTDVQAGARDEAVA